MSESESTTASTIVRQTRLEYEEMRRKLAETEKKLNRLARLEAQDQARSAPSGGMSQQEAQHTASSHNLQTRRDAGDHGSMPDLQLSVPSTSVEDVHSVRSELSTVPGSYTGFASRPFPASTPSRQALPRGDGQPVGEDVYDSDSSGSLHQGGGNNSNSNNNSVKLLRQNQRLLSEVERLVCELQSAKHREGELSLELESSNSQVTELQERVEELKAEIEAQDKALRSAEQHLSDSQRQANVVQQELLSCQRQIEEMRSEVEEGKKTRNSVEAQRDEAVQNFLEAQTALEDFQRRNHERVKMLEESEDHLRDSLAHTNAERDELLQRVESLQSTVTAHEAETGRLQALNAMEQETKDEMEAQNLDLRRQLAKLTTRLHKAEEGSLEISRLRQENAALLSEVEETRDIISQLEDIADHLRKQRSMQQSGMADDSGNFSVHLGTSMRSNAASVKGGSASYSCSDARGLMGVEGNTNNNGSTITNLLSELRIMLYEMDAEINRLRQRVGSQEEDQRIVRDLREELTSLMNKADKGERQTRELEKMIGRLEADKASLARQVHLQEEEIATRDSQLLSVEARLAQRNTLIIEMQEDTNKRCEQVARLEKELWKKSSTISQLEACMEEKRDEINGLHSQLTQNKHDTVALQEELNASQKKVKMAQMDAERCRATEQQNQSVLSSQCYHFERQLEMLRMEVDAKETLNAETQRLVQQAQQDASKQENLIHQLETTLLETKQELSDTNKRSKEMMMQLESKLSHSAQQNNQLESALLLCRNEIAEHLSSMDRTRQKFDMELSKRDQAIERQEDRLQSLQCELEQRTEEGMRMDRELAEKQTMVQHCQSRVAQLEHSENTLKENVKQLEQQLMREKGQWMMEADDLERKLGTQSAELDAALAKCSDFKQTIRELQEEVQQTQSDRASLEQALQNEKVISRSDSDRVTRLEKDLRDMRVELEQKIEMVSDLEDTLRNKDADLDQQRSLVEQLDVDKLRMQRELKQLEETKSQLQESVERLQFDGRAKEQILHDTREILKKTEGELSEKTVEASRLHDVLDERQGELEERVVAVQKLEQTISETQEEMSQRMQRVDSTLHKYEIEITERTAQIANLDDRLKETQGSLLETSRQLQQQQQLTQRQQMELQAATAKAEELENTNAHQKQRLEEQRKEIVDMTQDIRLTREQQQTEHLEFLNVRRDLLATRREVERLGRELEEREAAQRCKELDTARLSEELGSCRARATQAEAKLAAHNKQHERDMAELKETYQQEVEAMRKSRDDAVDQHKQAMSKIKSQSQQMSENERLFHQRLEMARSELEKNQNELSAHRELIRNTTDTICSKDHEIASLKAQVSRLEQQRQVKTSAATTYQGSYAGSSALSRDEGAYNTLVHSTLNEQTTSTPPNNHDHHQHFSSTRHYFMSSGPSSPLTLRDLSYNNANPTTSCHNINELPMKDTWHDRESQNGDYTTDHLVFSFEKLGAGLIDKSGDCDVPQKDTKSKDGEQILKNDAITNPQPSTDSKGLKEKRENIGNKRGGNGVRSAASTTLKVQTAHSRAQSAPSGKSQSLKLARRKGKPGSAKVPVKRWSGGRGEKGDLSHHYKDPETLVSTYKGGTSPSMPGKEMENLQQQLQANAIRQQEIERQLRSLDDSSDGPPPSDDLIDFTAD